MLNTLSPWPYFARDEIDAVTEVLLSGAVNYWTGQQGKAFEQEFAHWVGCEYGVAVSNGTVALELALRALGVTTGDEVIVPARTFFASASSIIAVGAKPVFADVDIDSQNITVETIAPCITEKTKAIICVHLAGWPCEMDKIMAVAEQHGIFVVEDCAQAHGARYLGKSVGSWGHIGAWSFCQDKIMTTGGEGGMVTTNDELLWNKMWSYKDHGKSYTLTHSASLQEEKHVFRWLHETFGTNWRLTEMQAAIGRIQLKKIDKWHKERIEHAFYLREVCSAIPALRVPSPPQGAEHAYYKFYVFVRQEKLLSGWDRVRIIKEINEQGIPCFSGACSEVYLEKAFEETGMRPNRRLLNAVKLGDSSLMFLVHPSLTNKEIIKTGQVIQEVFSRAIKLKPVTA